MLLQEKSAKATASPAPRRSPRDRGRLPLTGAVAAPKLHGAASVTYHRGMLRSLLAWLVIGLVAGLSGGCDTVPPSVGTGWFGS